MEGRPIIDPLPLLLAAAARDGRTLFGLAAEPGAGKTTLAAQLCADVNAAHPGACIALSMDGFHLTRAQLSQGVAGRSAEESHARRGAPWTFAPAALAAKLRAVRAGYGAAAAAPVGWPGFEHAKKDPEEDALLVAPTVRVVLVEGLYLLHRADGFEALEGALDATWYLATPFAVADARLCQRHQVAWVISEAEARSRIAVNDGVNALLCRQGIARADGLVQSRQA
jgi:pantothenate kinase